MRDEREARARYLLGRLLSDIYSYERAAGLLRDALDYMPELVAARVHLGVAYCGLERYEEMLGELREAIRLDVQAVRAAVREEPKELGAIRKILYPPQRTTQQGRENSPPIATDLCASAALAEQGMAELAAGHDRLAVDLIERALRLDPTRTGVIAMLTLAYLLSLEGKGKPLAVNEGSVLWEELPELAEALFKGSEAPPLSHINKLE